MTTNQTILLGALLICASLFALNGVRSAHADITGPYQLVRHSNPNTNVGVFRIDTSTGEVSYCYLTHSDELVCSKSVR
ncbi:MAG: hypothetical protein AB7E52_03380 [Bdellovibrionales bacterium]